MSQFVEEILTTVADVFVQLSNSVMSLAPVIRPFNLVRRSLLQRSQLALEVYKESGSWY
ncbi:hypothetical protein CKA32_005272 [Geitlerinema sp. FC II]|nr:hypothetical protein CKA32_005272 [Geitlerinema sp. FC II]